MLKNEIRKGIITSIYRTQFEFIKEMNTRSMTKKMLANNDNIINDNNMDDNDIMRQKFANEIRDLTNINVANQDTSYESLKARLRPISIVAKKIYNEYADIMPHYSDNQNGRLLSVFYLTLHRLMNEADNLHRKEYIDSEKRILKIRKMTLNMNKKCRKCLFMLWDIIQNFNKKLIPNYDLVVEKHNQLLNQYDLRPRNAVYYGEEDQVDDLSDADYCPIDDNLNQRLARINKAVSFVVNKYSNKRLNADDDEDYDPADDASDNDDDESVYFDEDDYADELEEDDDDYEDEDEYRQADLEFLDEYFNDPDYKKEKKLLNDDDDDEEYLPEDDNDDDDDDDDDDYLLDSTSECDYEDDSSSDYDPSEDADGDDDDEQLLFDDDDLEEDDDDYEDDSEDNEDAQFVSDYFNDPDYDPNDDIEEEDELEYDFSFKNKKENIELVLEAGIENEEDDDDSEDYVPNEDDEDEDEEEVMYSCKKNNLINVCKRFYDRKTGKVRYNWVQMNAEDYAKKYDEDYENDEEM